MTINIWDECNGAMSITSLQLTAWRMIEGQESAATRKLVDSLDEQMTLEDMIESSKPPIMQAAQHAHPLLYTPFRYPPLKYGSRFSKRTEPSLWYGSLNVETAMAEKAYYQLHFLRASVARYDMVQLPLTIFSTRVSTNQGVRLDEAPFSNYQSVISSPVSYQSSQLLGSAMRFAAVQAFTYYSARYPGDHVNVALFTPAAFQRKNPEAQSFQSWQCTVNNHMVEFTRSSVIQAETKCFAEETFLVNGELPFPAM